ncbi:MAG: DUF151 domain-containing protein [Bacteroidetes bacterium]|nr:DUF151 domain-containing protein [Rhodothermia bacterium]MCS7155531.1 DUF151 domain-containing protein [Bacteroidota bacterium]MCX7907376.1 DUF151 domain-containing protein [Bacteroidota bacterium]MDW8138370.1 DUF151 domain-containing protein [Bacteroidota bacterium]MDW8284693.1 DUF151 domain-containing protein [Bacteroidota bacterium]
MAGGGAYALILQEVAGSRRLPIIIGAFEAQAIAIELEKVRPPRPMTHDLMRNMLEALNVHVQEVYIHDLRDGTFYAQIRYEHNGLEDALDARPSDAIALAVRVEAPIYVAESVLEEAGIPVEPESEEEHSPTSPPRRARGASRADRLAELQEALQRAIENEDYELAARLRDEIEQLKRSS